MADVWLMYDLINEKDDNDESKNNDGCAASARRTGMTEVGISLSGIAVALLFAAWSSHRARCERRDVVCLTLLGTVLGLPGAVLLAL